MKIKRAVKSAAIEEQLKEALDVAKKIGAKGLEIQEIMGLIDTTTTDTRAKIVIDACKEYPISSLAYHFPLKPVWNTVKDAKKFDLVSEDNQYILDLTEETIKEAVEVGSSLDINKVYVDVHLFGFADQKEINYNSRRNFLKKSREVIGELAKMSQHYSQKYGCDVYVLRENEPPEHGEPEKSNVQGTIDFDPRDTLKTADIAGITLDFAHLWQTLNYFKSGNGEFPGVELSKKEYMSMEMGKLVATLLPALRLIHMNDAKGYRKFEEGIEIGLGDFPHGEIIPLIASHPRKSVMGTYEIKYGHKDPETMLRSDQFYRNLFGDKFNEYFE